MLLFSRFAFTILAFLWSGLALVAQNDSIVIIPKIHKGEVLKLEMTRVKYDDNKSELRKKMILTSEAELKCVDIKKDEIVWHYTINKSDIKGLTDEELAKLDIITRYLTMSINDVTYEFATDLEGTYLDLLNYPQVSKKIDEYIVKMMDYVLVHDSNMSKMSDDEKKKLKKSIVEVWKNTSNSKISVLKTYLRELQLYLFANGLRMNERDTLSMETEIPFPIANHTLVGDQIIYIKKETADEILLYSEVKVDSVHLKEAINKVIKSFNKSYGEPKFKGEYDEKHNIQLTQKYDIIWDKKKSKITSAVWIKDAYIKIPNTDKEIKVYDRTTVRLIK